MTTIDVSSDLLASGPGPRGSARLYSASSFLSRLFHRIHTWEERRHVHALPDRLLKTWVSGAIRSTTP